MKIRYRVPKIEEFHQGMKYQLARDTQLVIWDAKEGIAKEGPKQRTWLDREVWWMGEPKESHMEIDSEGNKITCDAEVYDWFYRTPPFNVEGMLEQGLIRVKI